MATNAVSALEKAAFVASLMLLAFLYGFAARWHGWFPNALLERASEQVTGLYVAWTPGPVARSGRVYDRSGVRVPTPDATQPGLTLLQSSWNGADGWTPGVRLIDQSGTVVHEWTLDQAALFPTPPNGKGGAPTRRSLHGSHLFPNGDLLVNLQYIGTVRVDACGDVLWRAPIGAHHSIERAADGSFWVPGMSPGLRSSTERHPDGLPGLETPLYLDRIVHLAADGTVLDTIDVLDILYANDLDRYLSKASQPRAGTDDPETTDLTHMNDVEPLPPALAADYPLFEAGDLLVSLRNLHLVFVVDPTSLEVKWHASAPFIQQHDPNFLEDGWIGVFDNNEDFTPRGTMLEGSRIVALQPHTDSMEVRFPTPHSEPFYTDIRGKWQALDNGNLLLTEGQAGRVVEVGPDGRTVWEWVHAPYSADHTVAVQQGARYDLTAADVASWPCSPPDAPPGP
jgi:hypothetical protein